MCLICFSTSVSKELLYKHPETYPTLWKTSQVEVWFWDLGGSPHPSRFRSFSRFISSSMLFASCCNSCPNLHHELLEKYGTVEKPGSWVLEMVIPCHTWMFENKLNKGHSWNGQTAVYHLHPFTISLYYILLDLSDWQSKDLLTKMAVIWDWSFKTYEPFPEAPNVVFSHLKPSFLWALKSNHPWLHPQANPFLRPPIPLHHSLVWYNNATKR